MNSHTLVIVSILLSAAVLKAQADPKVVRPILTRSLEAPQVVTAQLQQFVMARVPPLVMPSTPEAWTAEEQRIREHLLNDVVFHGWPRQWVN